MTTVYDVPPMQFIELTAEKLSKELKAPEWASYVKTGVHREKPPTQDNWWSIRSAAVLRKVYIEGPIGVTRLSEEFGGPVDRRSKPNRACRGSRAIIRQILHQLEALGYVDKMGARGRVASAKGRSLLDNTAHELKQDLVKSIPGLDKY